MNRIISLAELIRRQIFDLKIVGSNPGAALLILILLSVDLYLFSTWVQFLRIF